MMVLRVNEIEVKMGLQQILRGISLAVNDKAIVTVLGSNGVGKTTLLKAISGIYRCAKGTIEFMGKEITNLPSHVTVKLGLCQAPEGRQMFSNMTVLENLKIGGYYRRPGFQERPLAEIGNYLDHRVRVHTRDGKPPREGRLKKVDGLQADVEQRHSGGHLVSHVRLEQITLLEIYTR